MFHTEGVLLRRDDYCVHRLFFGFEELVIQFLENDVRANDYRAMEISHKQVLWISHTINTDYLLSYLRFS